MYTKNFTPTYASVNEELYMTFPRFLEEIQEASLLHSENTDFPLSWFMENQKGWVIVSWSIEIYEYPKWAQEYKITTWPSNYKRFFTNREFLISTKDNREIAKVSSQWMLLDLEKKRPIRIPKDFLTAYGEIKENPLLTPLEEDISNYHLKEEKKYQVSPLDIDNNGHVNNVNYIHLIFRSFIIDSLPSKIHIDYKKECTLGETITIQYFLEKDTHSSSFYAKIINKEGETCCTLLAK